ncbi:MAG: pilus assembly protein TadG-related protein [Candidatus Omnitrophota bacterium]
MNHLMRTLISLAHLTKAKSKSGQIATLLLLLLVIMLIFVMVTVNLGNVAVDATKISNAADSAVLQLASNLSTKAKMLYEGLGNTYERCQRTGWLAVVLAVVVAVVITVATYGSGWASWAPVFAAIGGAVAGAIGGAIAGTGWAQGAVTGAAIGFAIGSVGAGIGEGVVVSDGSMTSAEMLAAGAEGFAVGDYAVFIPTMMSSSAAFGTLGLASTVYNASVQDSMSSVMVAQLQKDLSKLNEYDRFRESAFFTALSQVVDDPNVHADTDDLDADTNTTELIPWFAWWWHRRMVEFANVRNAQIAPLNSFLADMRTFRDFAYQSYAGDGITDAVADPPTVHSPGYLERADYKWTIDSTGKETAVNGVDINGADIGVVDGVIVDLLRPLHNFGYDTTWTDGSLLWETGPAPAEMNTWLGVECNSSGANTCTPAPTTYDYLDRIADDLREMVKFMAGIIPPTFETWVGMAYANVNSGGWGSEGFWSQPWLAALETQYNGTIAAYDPQTNWEGWRYYFYNPSNPTDPDTYYTQLQKYIDILTRLKSELVSINDRLPPCNEGKYDTNVPPQCVVCSGSCNPMCNVPGVCHLGWVWEDRPMSTGGPGWYLQCISDCSVCAFNPPCRPSIGGGTIDESTNDEFGPALGAIDDLIGRMTDFRTRIQTWSDEMDGYIVDVLSNDLGGLNPITYRWTDMRGDGRVVVQAGLFALPAIVTRESGNWLSGKTCATLVDHSDLNGDRCWIKVTKYPPSNVSLGPLGRWNPFMRGVSKVSKAYYAINSVGIKAKDL